MARKTKTFAVFDIDGTIFRSSLLIELIHELVLAGIFSKKVHSYIEKEYTAWLERKGTYEDYIHAVVRAYDKEIIGKKKSDIVRVARKLIGIKKDRVYRFSRDLIRDLKKKKVLLLAVSGSPHYIVELFAQELGFDYSFGHIPETVLGRFTGKHIKDNSIKNKARVVKEFEEESGFVFDYKKSYAIGDTEGDISILSLVGNPIAFNPNKELEKHARKHKWRIVVERKDVIYDITHGTSL